MIYLYAVVDDPGVRLAGLEGLDGAPLVRVAEGRVAAVGSVHAELDLEPDPSALWAHERVTAELMQRCTVAPVRFGTVVQSPGDLSRLLASEECRLVALLAPLAGRVELAVRGRGLGADPTGRRDAETSPGTAPPTAAPPATGSSGTGRDYLRGLREADLSPDAARLPPPLAGVHAALSRRSVRSTVTAGADDTMVAAYLVDAGDVAGFRRRVEVLAERDRGMSLSLTGPWAPFSFVAGEVTAGA